MKKYQYVDGVEFKADELPRKPKKVHCPWIHFVALLILGEWSFVRKSIQRIKGINALNYKTWLRKIDELVEKRRTEERVRKQDEEEQRWAVLRRGGGNIAVWPYAFPSQYAAFSVGQNGFYNSDSTTGNPYIYNGQIVQRS
jgi:hypothetical protein